MLNAANRDLLQMISGLQNMIIRKTMWVKLKVKSVSSWGVGSFVSFRAYGCWSSCRTRRLKRTNRNPWSRVCKTEKQWFCQYLIMQIDISFYVQAFYTHNCEQIQQLLTFIGCQFILFLDTKDNMSWVFFKYIANKFYSVTLGKKKFEFSRGGEDTILILIRARDI